MTQIFIKNAELLAEGETTEDHTKWQLEEAELVEKDKNTAGNYGGLFRGNFPLNNRRNFHPIRDDEDGVSRCPRCAWELEDGYCVSCEFRVPHSMNSGSASPSVSYYTEDEMTNHESMEAAGYFYDDFNGPDIYSGISEDSGEEAMAMATEQAAIRRRNRARQASASGRIQPLPLRRAYLETDNEGDTDEYSAEDDDAGSLEHFVVNDVEEGPFAGHSPSPRSSHYDSDEVSGIITHHGLYSSEEDQSPSEESEFNLHNQPSENQPINLDSDSDEGPILRTGRHLYQSSTVSPSPSPSPNPTDVSEESAVARYISRPQQSRRQQNNHVLARQSSTTGPTTTNNVRTPGRRSGSRGVAVEVDSDSDSPSQVQRPRRRRALGHLLLSDDDEDNDTVAASANGNALSVSSHPSSNGTATIGRPSPTESSSNRDDATEPALQASHIPSPIVINSSPVGSDTVHDGWSPYHESDISLEDVSRAPLANIARSGNNRRVIPGESFMQRNEPRRRLLLPRPHRPSVQPSSSLTPQLTSPRGLAEGLSSDRVRHVIHGRIARKAGRQLAKQDRRRREQEQANIPGSSRHLASLGGSEVMNLDGGVQCMNQNRDD